MRSSYHIYKVSREHVKEYKIKNTEYDKAKDEAMKNSTSLSSNLIQDKEKTQYHSKKILTCPHFYLVHTYRSTQRYHLSTLV